MSPKLSISGHQPENVLITGGCGFIGSNFINFMFNKWSEAIFVNFDKLAIGADPEHVAKQVQNSGRYRFVRGDLMDLDVIYDLLDEFKIDTVVHFAAITHVDESYDDPIGTTADNVVAMTTLLEAVKKAGTIKRFVHISTDEVYGDSDEGERAKTELDLPNPTNPYAASKAACEYILRSYYHSFKIPYVTVRMNNVYGPRQFHSKLIPKFIQLAIEQKPYSLRGDGQHTRSWMFVEDCAEAIKRVAEFGKIGEVYNIGIDFEKSNLEVTKIIHHTVAKLLKRSQTEPEFITIPDRPYHDRRYHIDFSKINRELGWQCTTPFSVGFALTIEYYINEYLQERNEQENRLQG